MHPRVTTVSPTRVEKTFVLPIPLENMPPTLEAECTTTECELDMVELHYTYELVDATAEDFRCPLCGTQSLEKLSYTYDEG